MNIIGYHIFPKQEMFKNNIFIKIKLHYPSGVRVKCIDCNDEAIINGFKPMVDELDVDFSKDRLILIIDRE